MKAYELNASVTADGHIELPDFKLTPTSNPPSTVKVIILVAEPDEVENNAHAVDEDFSAESFAKSWQQAMNGETVPIAQLWEETDLD
jgi:hypothetical protein